MARDRSDHPADGLPVRWQARAGDGRYRRTRSTAEWDARVCDLVEEGWSYRQIARELGYASASSVHDAYRRALADVVRPAAEDALRTQLARLDTALRAAMAVLRASHWIVTPAGVVATVLDPATGMRVPLPDAAPVLAAIDRIRGIEQDRAKLLGLYAPVRSRVEVITEDTVDAEIRRLEDELGDLVRGGGDADHAAAGGGGPTGEAPPPP